MNIKKVLVAAVLSVTVLTSSAYAKSMEFTMGDVNVNIKGTETETKVSEVAPYTVNDRTVVPVRIISESFGATVDWNEATSEITVTLNDKVVKFVLGNNIANVNGKEVTMDIAPFETNGRTMIPLRVVSECFGFRVDYVDAGEQVLITDDPVVLKVGDEDINLNIVKLLYNFYKIKYGTYYTDAEYLNQALNDLVSIYALNQEANSTDFELTADELGTIKESAKANYDASEDCGLLSEFAFIMTKMLKGNIYQEAIGYGIEVTDDEVLKEYNENYMAAKHILISADTEKADSKIKEIKLKLGRNADFDDLMFEFSEDGGLASNPNGYVFTSGDMISEFEDAVKSLEIDQVSDIVKTEFGYHIIKRIALPDLDETRMDTVRQNLAGEIFNQKYSEIISKYSVKSDYTMEQLLEMVK